MGGHYKLLVGCITNYILLCMMQIYVLISYDSQSKTNGDQYRVLAFFIVFRGVINLIYTYCSCVIGGGMPVGSNGTVK
jgi:hypothetical protein